MKDEQNKKTVRIWNESYKDSKEKPDFYVKLEQSENDDIHLFICDEEGKEIKNGPIILTLDFDYKTIAIHSYVNEYFPLRKNYKNECLVDTTEEISKFSHDNMMKSHIMNMLSEKLEKHINEKPDNATIN